jgi:hypothetical protein
MMRKEPSPANIGTQFAAGLDYETEEQIEWAFRLRA